ncbi:hypothetical protein SCOR_06915 [Sulfidibacter corallicola]
MSEPGAIKWPNPDSLLFHKVDKKWSARELLEQKGWFPLPDVMKKLDAENTGKYRKILALRDKLVKNGSDPVLVMGLKQFGSRIWAFMPTFNVWFRDSEALQVVKVPKHWDFNTFLQQPQGIFSLRGVMELVPQGWPLKYPAMKNMVNKMDDPKTEMGIGKIEGVGYVVFQPEFGDWLKKQFL